MGGKKQQRTKGNVQPSKSSRAAEMLNQEQSGGFIGFGGLKEAAGNSLGYVPRIGIGTGASEDGEFDADSELRMVMRRMTKKDTTTRLKAIQEFNEMCITKTKEDVQGILPFWPKIYNKLALDVDHRAREAAQIAHCQVISQAGRKLAPYLKLIISNWLLSQFDPSLSASLAAKKAFETAFSGSKQIEAILFCRKEIFESFHKNLFHSTSETLSDPKVVPKEEREAKYHRMLSCTLLAINYIIWSAPQDSSEVLTEDFESVVNEKKFWKLSKHSTPLVRGAFYELLSTFLEKHLVVLSNVKQSLCPVVFDAVNETSPAVVKYSWNCILQTVKYIEDCWQYVNMQKFVLPKLWSTLKSSGHGNFAIVYPCILPFISNFPNEVIGNKETFYKTLFLKFKEGLLSDRPTASTEEKKAIVSSYISCMKHCLANASADDVLDESNREHDPYNSIVLLMDILVLDLLKSAVFQPTVWTTDLYRHIRNMVEQVLKDSSSGSENFKSRVFQIFTLLKKNLESIVENVVNSSDAKAFSSLETFFRYMEPPSELLNTERLTVFAVGYKTKEFFSESLDFFLSLTTRLQKSLCTLCCKKIVEEGTMPYIGLLTKVGASYPIKSIIQCTDEALGGVKFAEDPDDFKLCHSAAKTFVKLYIKNEWNFSENEGSSLDISDVSTQRELIYFLSRIAIVIEDPAYQLKYCTKLLELSSSREYLCTLIKEVSKILSEDMLRRWFAASGAGAILIELMKKTLSESLTHNILPDLFEALKRITIISSSGDLVLGGQEVDALSQLLKSQICKETSNPNSSCVEPELISFSLSFIENTQSHFFASAMDVIIGIAHFMVYSNQDVLTSLCRKSIVPIFQKVADGINNKKCLEKLELWIKNTYRSISSYSRLLRLLDFIRNILKGYVTEKSQVSPHLHMAMSFLTMLLPSKNDTEQHCHSRIEFKTLLPLSAVTKGILDASFLETQDNVKPQEELATFPLALPLFGLHLLEVILENDKDEVIKDLHISIVNGLITIWSALCFQSNVQKISCCLRPSMVLESKNADETGCNVVKSIEIADEIIARILHQPQFPVELLLRRSIEYSVSNGALGIVCFDAVLRKATYLKGAYCNELIFETFGNPKYSDRMSVNAAIVAFSHLNDLSIIRALLEQSTDEFTSVDSLDIQGTCGLFRMCLGTLQSWYSALKVNDDNVDDFNDFIPVFFDNLIAWKEARKDWLIFSLSSVSNASIDKIELNIVVSRLLVFFLSVAPLRLNQPHWDFLLCACASWMQALENIPLNEDSNKVLSFFAGSVLNLVSLSNEIFDKRAGTDLSTLDLIVPTVKTNYEWLSSQPDFTPFTQVEDKLITEWEEFFSPSIHQSGFKMFQSLSVPHTTPKSALNQAANRALLQCLSSGLMKFPSLVLYDIAYGHSGYEKKAASKSNTHPKPVMEIFDFLFATLGHSVHNAAVTSYQLLARLARMIHQDLCTSHEEEEGAIRSLPRGLMEVFETCTTHILSIFDEAGVWIGEPLLVIQNTDLQYFLGYFLSWLLIFRIIKLAPASSRAAYASFLSKNDLLHTFVIVVFSVLPNNQGWSPGTGKRHLNLSYDKLTTSEIQRLAFAVYYSGLECTPALIRSVWNNALDRKSAGIIEKFTSRLVSPNLCSEEINLIQASCSSFDNMDVKCRPAAREVAAIYSIEDISMELVVKLSSCHPLIQINVECGKRVGVTTAQWRQWMLQLTMFLTQQNGSVLDGLTLWKKNVDKKFEGIEECMICFSVIHGANYSLPTLGCKTCKKKFHAACLYKWFHTSNNSTCPLCRNTF